MQLEQICPGGTGVGSFQSHPFMLFSRSSAFLVETPAQKKNNFPGLLLQLKEKELPWIRILRIE
jgi:hypothetical protein